VGAIGVLALICLAAVSVAAARIGPSGGPSHGGGPSSTCQLKSAKGNIKHVVFIIFDNVHFLRDNPNVPSDLQQMPHLLNFIRGNGTLLTNDHTVLISHTANGILTNLTGMYSDRHGQAVANSYRYFKPDGTTASSSSFKYWTDLTDDIGIPPADPTPVMVNGDSGTPKNTPAPWVPYTRAGCDWGATALANVVLENTGTGPNGDMTKVFGSGSPEWNEAQTSAAAPAGTAARDLAQTDFVGLAIHCGSGGGICKGNPNARPDLLPDEPGGYNGFQGLFGGKYVNPAICAARPQNCTNVTVNGQPQPALKKLDGTLVTDQFGQPGFPGFDGLFASTTLSYVAQMQESGIPVTFGYISDAHDQHGVAGEIHATRGPGEADYVQQLKNYDTAFGQFFDRLKADGINKSNTLFVFTVEEGDHFAGSAPSPANCDGVTVPCTYSLVGEVNGNLSGLLAQDGVTTPFTVHSDMAPTIYLNGNPTRDAPVTRTFGRTLANMVRVNPYTNKPDADRGDRGHGRDEGDPHDHGGSAADADPDHVRPARLVLLRDAAAAELQHDGVHHRPDDPADEHVRLEPRRHPAGDRDDVGRHRRAGRPEQRRRPHVGRPHGHPSDHARPGRPPRHLRPRRAGARRPTGRAGGAAVAAGAS